MQSSHAFQPGFAPTGPGRLTKVNRGAEYPIAAERPT
jgi:hypothetical protein